MSKKNRVGKNKNYVQPKKKVETLQELFEKSHQYMSNGNFDKARPLLLKIQKSSPDLPGVLHSLGIIAIETNDPSKAVDYFKRAVQIAPDAAELWNLLGAALQATEQRYKAIEAMERAVALDPNYAKAHFNLANLLNESGIIDRADHEDDPEPSLWKENGEWPDACGCGCKHCCKGHDETIVPAVP